MTTKFERERASSPKNRHTFHINDAVMCKLRDVVYYIQKNPKQFLDFANCRTLPTLSTLAEMAIVDLITGMEGARGRAFPKRPKDEGVHFGRPRAHEDTKKAKKKTKKRRPTKTS